MAKIVSWLAALMSVVTFCNLAFSQDETLHLVVGTSTTVHFPESADLHVTRRGVVDLFYLGGGDWRLTGLRAGFIVLSADRSPARYFVEVKPRSRTTPPRENGDWLCRSPGISCLGDKDGPVIGLTDNERWYELARDHCHEIHRPFAVALTPAASQRRFVALQKSLGPEFRLEENATGALVARAYCQTDDEEKRLTRWADYLSAGALSRGEIYLLCHADATRFRLEAKVFLLEESAAEELGLVDDPQLNFHLPPVHLEASLLAKLKAYIQQNRAKIIGEPLLRLSSGKEGHVVSGGEFATVYDVANAEPREAWKAYGLDLSVTLTPVSAERVRLNYKLSLKNPKDNGALTTLQANALSAELALALGESIVVGGVQVASEATTDNTMPVAGNLPIVGPLFRLAGHQRACTRLFVWFTVTKDDAGKASKPPS